MFYKPLKWNPLPTTTILYYYRETLQNSESSQTVFILYKFALGFEHSAKLYIPWIDYETAVVIKSKFQFILRIKIISYLNLTDMLIIVKHFYIEENILINIKQRRFIRITEIYTVSGKCMPKTILYEERKITRYNVKCDFSIRCKIKLLWMIEN